MCSFVCALAYLPVLIYSSVSELSILKINPIELITTKAVFIKETSFIMLILRLFTTKALFIKEISITMLLRGLAAYDQHGW